MYSSIAYYQPFYHIFEYVEIIHLSINLHLLVSRNMYCLMNLFSPHLWKIYDMLLELFLFHFIILLKQLLIYTRLYLIMLKLKFLLIIPFSIRNQQSLNQEEQTMVFNVQYLDLYNLHNLWYICYFQLIKLHILSNRKNQLMLCKVLLCHIIIRLQDCIV